MKKPSKPSKFKLHTLIYDMESNEYHSTPDTYSSTQLKDCLEDEELFHKKHVEKSIKREENAAFDIGTYFHTGCLEPHKLEIECVTYIGNVRRGAKWDKFAKLHKGKLIITKRQEETARTLIKSVQDSPVAMSYITKGKPEVTAFLEIVIDCGEIYAPKHGLVLGREGWEKVEGKIALTKRAVPMVIKARADSMGDDFILDLKSTSGNAKSDKKARDTISYYNYDLSAAFYLDIFTAVAKRPYRKFIWTFASKDLLNCRSYLASDKNIQVGRAKYRKALFRIAEGIKNKWVFADTLGVLDPNNYELEHLAISDLDLA